ncbi:hypothetical protein M0802_006213 [Mischocyttarus mexicanus]|nr:hypothetical protein M0802_006213 [Mischocyttarus mexicanus]
MSFGVIVYACQVSYLARGHSQEVEEDEDDEVEYERGEWLKSKIEILYTTENDTALLKILQLKGTVCFTKKMVASVDKNTANDVKNVTGKLNSGKPFLAAIGGDLCSVSYLDELRRDLVGVDSNVTGTRAIILRHPEARTWAFEVNVNVEQSKASTCCPRYLACRSKGVDFVGSRIIHGSDVYNSIEVPAPELPIDNR